MKAKGFFVKIGDVKTIWTPNQINDVEPMVISFFSNRKYKIPYILKSKQSLKSQVFTQSTYDITTSSYFGIYAANHKNEYI